MQMHIFFPKYDIAGNVPPADEQPALLQTKASSSFSINDFKCKTPENVKTVNKYFILVYSFTPIVYRSRQEHDFKSLI